MPWDFYLIFLLLAVFLPWRGWAKLERLKAMNRTTSRQRLALYFTSISLQWVVTGLVAWRAFARGLTFRALGFNLEPIAQIALLGVGGAVLVGIAHWLNLRRLGRIESPQTEKLRALAELILPQSNKEAAVFSALSLTAGFCEEFIYRGFVFAALAMLHSPWWVILLASSVLFGVAHAYQGRGGVLATLLLGIVFGSVRFLYDSVLPVMIWHAAVDLVAGFASRAYLIRNK
jgi:membrane protease YdiL (CAAX protease family)